MTIEGRVVVVTGVSSGLGRAIARVFAGQGARLIGSARRAELGEELAREVSGSGGDLAFVPADVRKVDDCRRIVQTALDLHGRIDVLINNAAVRSDPPLLALHEVDEDNWDNVFDTNVKGAFFCTRFAVEAMMRQGRGMILNIASTQAVEATAGMAPYATSKAALVQLTRATAVEYVGAGIKANAIVLGGTATGQEKRTAAAGEAFAETKEASSAGLQVELYDPDEVARALALLCHDDAHVITGASIAIDYGWTAGLYASRYTHLLIASAQR